jgi:predicted small lipoprotein YifL
VLARIGLLLIVASALALAGCGRKGPLEPPPGVVQEKPVAKPAAKRPDGSTAPNGLFRDATDSAAPTTPERKPRATGSFVLDPLLQ